MGSEPLTALLTNSWALMPLIIWVSTQRIPIHKHQLPPISCVDFSKDSNPVSLSWSLKRWSKMRENRQVCNSIENSSKPAMTPQSLKIPALRKLPTPKSLTVTICDPMLGQCQSQLSVIFEEGRQYQRDEPLCLHPTDVNTNIE